MQNADKLSKHAVAQSQARKARHDMPACIMQTSYPSMHSSNHRPGKLIMLSQHTVEMNHKSGNQTHHPSMHSIDKLSQHALQNMHCLKGAAEAQNSGQADTAK